MQHLWASLLQLLHTNNFASGGFLLMAVGGVLASLRSIPRTVGRWIRERVIFSVELISSDSLFEWFTCWLDEHPSAARWRSVTALVQERLIGGDQFRTRLTLTPATGDHVIWHHGRALWLSRSRDREISKQQREDPRPRVRQGLFSNIYTETLTISVPWFYRAWLKELLAQITAQYAGDRDEGVSVYINAAYGWAFMTSRPPRDPETLVLQAGLWERLRSDLDRFRADELWYQRMGIPWRRGYLFHGPPGNGKTSTALALAGSLKLRLYVMNLASKHLDDEHFMSMLLEMPEHAILLLEDVDAAFIQRNASLEGRVGVSFSALLNALDGALSKHGQVVILSTNYPERLDPALVRPGRADVHVAFGNVDREQIVRLYQRFYPGGRHARAFAAQLPEGALSAATLQDYFLTHRDDEVGALAQAHVLLPAQEASA